MPVNVKSRFTAPSGKAQIRSAGPQFDRRRNAISQGTGTSSFARVAALHTFAVKICLL